jgi:hypothetical protein
VGLRSPFVRYVLIGGLLSVYALGAASSVQQKSITFDELGHLTGGVSAWLTGDYRLFPQNGQFPQRWAALPLVVLGVRFPGQDESAWWSSDLEAIGHQFLYEVGNDHAALVRRARVMMIALGVVLGWLCFAWSRRLFGLSAGLVTLCIFAFSPSMLAHGPLATSDLAAALMFTAALGSLWLVLHRATPLRASASALLMGLLFVTKMSAVLMAPIAVTLAAIRIWYGRPLLWVGRRPCVVTGRRRLALACAVILLVHALGVIVVIWGSYGFRYATFRAAVPGRDRMFLGETIDTLTRHEPARIPIVLARDLRLLPEAYLFGLAHVLNRSGRFIGFLNGRYSLKGWWVFFPYCWLVKTPLAVFALLGLAGAAAWRYADSCRHRRRRVQRAAYRLTPLFVFLAAYWAAAVTSSLNLGERHLLPAYPAAFILAGGAGCWLGRRHLLATSVAAVLLLSLPIEAFRIWPHYLAYFNALAGGPSSGYRHLVDSSLDWGQDLPGLARWLRTARTSSEPVYLSYFGSGDPAHYGIDARQIYSYQDWRRERPLHALTGGIYCISATMLQSVYTRAPGPWAAPYEAAYQRRRTEIERVSSRPREEPLTSDRETPAWRRLVNEFEQLRLARLSAYLRRREPDDQIGYSILIFRLTDREVEDALGGPPAELLSRPAVAGLDG